MILLIVNWHLDVFSYLSCCKIKTNKKIPNWSGLPALQHHLLLQPPLSNFNLLRPTSQKVCHTDQFLTKPPMTYKYRLQNHLILCIMHISDLIIHGSLVLNEIVSSSRLNAHHIVYLVIMMNCGYIFVQLTTPGPFIHLLVQTSQSLSNIK